MTELTPENTLVELAGQALDAARAGGASDAEVWVGDSSALSVRARGGDVEAIEFQRDRELALTVYVGQRSASVSTTELAADSLRELARTACEIARATGEDPCAGLPEPELLARNFPDLDLDHPWELSPREAIDLARRIEAAALACDARVRQVEDASVDTRRSIEVLANTAGFVGTRRASRHTLSCGAIAVDGERMQRDHDWATARVPSSLPAPEDVGRRAAGRVLGRLPRPATRTGRMPVILAADLARGLLGHFVAAVSGANLYRRASFLLDAVGQQVFPDWMTLRQRPHLPRAMGSAAFDDDGVATVERDLVRDGVLQGYVLGTYAARRLGLRSTGNAGGVWNLEPAVGVRPLRELLREAGAGLLVTELMGQGVNLVTGDYSRGAAGFWIENGELAAPAEGIGIAGNLREMFRGLLAFGDDVDVRGAIRSGSVLIDGLTVSR